jgi:hypothetical protein
LTVSIAHWGSIEMITLKRLSLLCFFVGRAGWSLLPEARVASCPEILNRIAEIASTHSLPSEKDFDAWMRELDQDPLREQLEYIPEEARAHGRRLGLSDMETVAINVYTGSVFMQVNRALIEGDPHKLAPLLPYISFVQSAILKLPDYKGQLRRYSTVRLESASGNFPAFSLGSIVQVPIIMSTSKPHATNTVQPWWDLIELESHSGKDISWLSVFEEFEQEVLYPIGATFRVKSIRPRPDGREGIKIYELEEVAPQASN